MQIIFKKILNTAAILFLVAAYLYFLKPLLLVDFWYDEVMSLEEFILVPFKKTVTDYPAPNNHVFFSLLMNAWLKLWGINTFAQAANNVWVVRLLPALISAATLITVYFTIKRLTKSNGQYTAVLALMCMLPFYNYAAQVRGYGLSMLLVALLANTLIGFYQKNTFAKSILIILFTALFIYTISSNLYPVAAFLVVAGMGALRVWIKQGLKTAIQSVHTKVILWVLAGIILAVILYLPVIKQVTNNDYVKSGGMFRAAIWGEAFIILNYLFKPYYISLLLISAGIIVAIIKKTDMRIVAAIGIVIILPFLFSFIRGDKPFDRTFLWICPLLAIVTGVLHTELYNRIIKKIDVYARLFTFAVLFFYLTGFDTARRNVRERLATDLVDEIHNCDMYYNNLLKPTHTHQNLGWFKTNYYSDSIPVYLSAVDKYAMHGYLPVHGINWEPDPLKIKSLYKYYIITATPHKTENDFLIYDSAFTFTRLNKQLDYVNILKAERQP